MFSSIHRKTLSATLALACSSYQGFSSEPPELQKPEKSEMHKQKTNPEEPLTTFSYHSLLQQLPLEETGQEILLERLSFHSTNYFAPHNLIELLNETIQQRLTGEETLGKPFWGEIRSSAKQAMRETIVRTAQVDDFLEKTFPGKVGEISYNMLKGKGEEGTLNNPFNPSKGFPGQELYAPRRLPKHWTIVPRLFNTNPSLNWTLRTDPFIFGAHAYRKGADAVVEIPLTQSWVLTSGVKIDKYNGGRAYGYVGIGGFVKKGYVTVGTRIPIQDSAENKHWTVVSCAWSF